jgi:hypothetical protein
LYLHHQTKHVCQIEQINLILKAFNFIFFKFAAKVLK